MTVAHTDPGTFLAALPRQLSYVPSRVAVLAGFDHRGSPGPFVVGEVHAGVDGDQLAQRMIRRLAGSHRDSLVAAVVTDEPRLDVLHAVQRVVAIAGVPVAAAVFATGTNPGARWACHCGCRRAGVVPDPDR